MAVAPTVNASPQSPTLPQAEIEFRAAILLCRSILCRLQLIAEGATAAAPQDTAIVPGSDPWACERCNHRNSSRTRRCVYCGATRTVAERGVKQPHFSTSQIPKGTRMGGDLTKPGGPNGHAPSKNFSLWGHYSYRMERAVQKRDTGQLLKLVGCATRDYELHARLRPAYHENHEAAVTELLRDCRGVPAIEAAWQLGAPVKWVRRQRALNGYDGEFGESRRQDERTQRVLELHANGLKQRMIADELGISQARVSQIVSGGR